MPLIGSHVTVTGGLAAGGLAYAAATGAEVIQLFVSNPRGWAAGPGDPGQDRQLRESGIPVFIHAPYLVNLGSGNPEVAGKSAETIAHALHRGGQIGARGVVVHTGSAAGWPSGGTGQNGDTGLTGAATARERALRQVGELVLPLLEKLGPDDPDLLFEPMAGRGLILCARAGDLADYLAAVEGHPRAGVCLDTCHMFAAGHDLTAPGGVRAMLAAVTAAAGPDRVRLVHANDSLFGCGSGRDRHESIGAGAIGAEPFRELLSLLPDVPFIAETPGGETGHARDIATLKVLRDTPGA